MLHEGLVLKLSGQWYNTVIHISKTMNHLHSDQLQYLSSYSIYVKVT